MTPSIDTTQALADTLAILQGKESLATSTIDYVTFQAMYNQAQEANKDHKLAILVRNHYVIVNHPQIWNRRVR